MDKNSLSAIIGGLAAVNFLIATYLNEKYPGPFEWPLSPGQVITTITLITGIALAATGIRLANSK